MESHFKQISKDNNFVRCFLWIIVSTRHHRFRRNEERGSVSCMFSVDIDCSNTSPVHWMDEAVNDIGAQKPQEGCITPMSLILHGVYHSDVTGTAWCLALICHQYCLMFITLMLQMLCDVYLLSSEMYSFQHTLFTPDLFRVPLRTCIPWIYWVKLHTSLSYHKFIWIAVCDWWIIFYFRRPWEKKLLLSYSQ